VYLPIWRGVKSLVLAKPDDIVYEIGTRTVGLEKEVGWRYLVYASKVLYVATPPHPTSPFHRYKKARNPAV
jgi:hypothetical protein